MLRWEDVEIRDMNEIHIRKAQDGKGALTMQRYESFNFSPIFLEASNYFVLQQITINGEDEEQRKSKKYSFFFWDLQRVEEREISK